jgi:3',5'-cyclic AMP phosphodiesterase CpdA
MSAPVEFVVLSDTHLVPHGQQIYGLDPRARLDAAVAFLNAHHEDAQFCLIAGDLAHWGEQAAYENVAAALEALRIPVVLMMGNHDKRAPFRTVFPDACDDGNGFVQTSRDLGTATLITLDTLNEDAGTHAGYLCAARLNFLDTALRAAPVGKPVVLAQHHPTRDLGLPSMDAIKLQNADDEWAVFERVGRKPDLMLHGHVHRPIFGTWRGIPFHIQRALSHQVAYDSKMVDHIPGSHEAPDLSVVRIADGDITVHQRSFLYDGPLFNLDDPQAVRGKLESLNK